MGERARRGAARARARAAKLSLRMERGPGRRIRGVARARVRGGGKRSPPDGAVTPTPPIFYGTRRANCAAAARGKARGKARPGGGLPVPGGAAAADAAARAV